MTDGPAPTATVQAIINNDTRLEFQRDLIHVVLRRPGGTFAQYAYLEPSTEFSEDPPVLNHWVDSAEAATPTHTAVPGVAFRRDDARAIAHAILNHLDEADPEDLAERNAWQASTISAQSAELDTLRAQVVGLERLLEARDETMKAMDHALSARMDNLQDLAIHRDDALTRLERLEAPRLITGITGMDPAAPDPAQGRLWQVPTTDDPTT